MRSNLAQHLRLLSLAGGLLALLAGHAAWPFLSHPGPAAPEPPEGIFIEDVARDAIPPLDLPADVPAGEARRLQSEDLVLYDRETGSFWYQLRGEAIRGPLAGRRLTQLPAGMARWSDWRALHPETAVYKPESELGAEGR